MIVKQGDRRFSDSNSSGRSRVAAIPRFQVVRVNAIRAATKRKLVVRTIQLENVQPTVRKYNRGSNHRHVSRIARGIVSGSDAIRLQRRLRGTDSLTTAAALLFSGTRCSCSCDEAIPIFCCRLCSAAPRPKRPSCPSPRRSLWRTFRPSGKTPAGTDRKRSIHFSSINRPE